MDDVPDIYTDTFGVTVAQFGCTLTLKRTYADAVGGTETRIVGYIRLTKELLLDLSRVINETASAAAAQGSATTIKH